jgi:cell division septation protein DedD
MNINYKESQIDFFAQASGKPAGAVPPRYLNAQISLSLENLVILSIAAIMVVIFSFSLGIERGKRIALAPAAEAVVDLKASTAALKDTGKVDKASAKNVVKDQPAQPSVKDRADALVTQDKPVVAGAYTVQVASYKTEKPARSEADKLKAKGFHDVYVMPKGSHIIVCVGNFQKQEDISGVKRQLKSRYQDVLVRRL